MKQKNYHAIVYSVSGNGVIPGVFSGVGVAVGVDVGVGEVGVGVTS